ncbi:MAG: hypothetical protein IJC43_07880 [Clostridia bacterium]|nr:hypothetical protein [Clostridia bacterium]
MDLFDTLRDISIQLLVVAVLVLPIFALVTLIGDRDRELDNFGRQPQPVTPSPRERRLRRTAAALLLLTPLALALYLYWYTMLLGRPIFAM